MNEIIYKNTKGDISLFICVCSNLSNRFTSLNLIGFRAFYPKYYAEEIVGTKQIYQFYDEVISDTTLREYIGKFFDKLLQICDYDEQITSTYAKMFGINMESKNFYKNINSHYRKLMISNQVYDFSDIQAINKKIIDICKEMDQLKALIFERLDTVY